MKIFYRIAAETFQLVVDEADDLSIYVQEILTALHDQHPELPKGPQLQVVVIEGLLDALADQQDEIELGDLGGRPTP